MGDLVEITSWPNYLPTICYKITSRVLSFEVKAIGNALIGLAKEPGPMYDISITIGNNNKSWIVGASDANDSKKIADTPDILSAREYRKFWIKWYGGSVRLGQYGETNPIVVYKCQIPDLKYVSLAIAGNIGVVHVGGQHPVHWRLIVPPHLETPKLKPVSNGDLHWVRVDSERQFPDDALIGGFEKDNLYIIRAPHRGSSTPGKFSSLEGLGYIPWGGEEHEKDSFEVLCGFDCTWVPTKHNVIPVGAVVGGHAEGFDREKLFIGRVNYMGHIIPGKVQPSHKVCYIPYDGKELAHNTYEILVRPNKFRPGNKMLKNQTSLDHYDEEDPDEDEDEDPDYDNQYEDYVHEYEDYEVGFAF